MNTAIFTSVLFVSCVLLVYSETFVIDDCLVDSSNCLKDSSVACCSLEYVADYISTNRDVDSAMIIINATLSLSSVIVFNDMSSINITGIGEAILNCEVSLVKTGLQFLHVSSVILHDISCKSCSSVYTVFNRLFLSGVMVFNSSKVSITRVTISDSSGYGLILINNRGSSNVLIVDSVFTGNRYNGSHSYIHSGGLQIYSSDLRQTTSVVNITGVNFTDNGHIVFQNELNFTQGGGAHIHSSNSDNIRVYVSNSHFNKNSATYGGGVFLLIEGNSTNNSMILSNCMFTQNRAGKGGAGADVGFIKYMYMYLLLPQNSSIHFRACVWDSNKSYRYGGGLSVFTDLTDFNTCINPVEFHGCNFTSNNASDGSAIHLEPRMYYSGIGRNVLTQVYFSNCNFKSNSASLSAGSLFTNGTTFIASIIRVTFQGNNTFQSNIGSSLLLSSATAVFENAVTKFINNTAERGAGIFLLTYSFFQVKGSNSFHFIDNWALYGAGLLSTQVHNLKFQFTDSCFVKGSDINQTSYIFHNNKAFSNIGADLFIYTLRPCILDQMDYSNVTDIFTKNVIGEFHVSAQSSTTVATSPKTLRIVDNHVHVFAIPGKNFDISIQQVDQLDHTLPEFFRLLIRQNDPLSSVEIKSAGFNNNTLSAILTGKPGLTSILVIESVLKLTPPISLNVTMDDCLPGYLFNYSTSDCQCSSDHANTTIPGITRCYSNEFALLSLGYWAGYINDSLSDNQTFATSSCPAFFCSFSNLTSTHSGLLKLDKTKNELHNDMCNPNRQGVVCYQCVEGTSVFYHSPTYSCNPDKYCNIGALFFLLSEIAPVTVMFLVIIFFNFNLTSGSMYTLMFYVQILDTFSIDGFKLINFSKTVNRLIDIYRFFYSIANMNFFTFEEFSFCIWSGATTMDVLLLKYAVSLYAFVLICSTIFFLKMFPLYNCIKLCRKCGRKNVRYSIVNSLSAFILISYFYLYRSSLSSIYCVSIRSSHFIKKVVLYDGSLLCGSAKHLQYMAPAIACQVLILIAPLLLLVEPIYVIVAGRLENRDYRIISRLNQFRALLKPFLDSFQSCFRSNCHVFAGLFFLYRLVLGELLVVTVAVNEEYFSAIITLIIIISIHAIVRPFAVEWHNKLDLFLLLNLLSVMILSYVNITNNYTVHSEYTDTIAVVQLILASTPFVVIILYCVRLVWKRFGPKINIKPGIMFTPENFYSVSQEAVFSRLDSLEQNYHSVS